MLAPNKPELFDIEIEQQILGALLVDNRLIDVASEVLQPLHFYEPVHQRIFSLTCTLFTDGDANPAILWAIMQGDPALEQLGGLNYLAAVAGAAPARPNVRQLTRIVRDYAARRELTAIGEAIIDSAQAGEKATPELFAEAAEALEAESQAQPDALEFVSAGSFEGLPIPPRQELVQGMIPANNVTLLGGDGGTGKTLLALGLGVSVSAGRKWLGKTVMQRGPVLYISAEDTQEELHGRLAAVLAAEGLRFADIPDFEILSLVGKDALLAAVDGPWTPLTPTPLYRSIEAKVRAVKPRLVALDTLSNVYGGDENNRGQARQFIGMLQRWTTRYDTTVLVLNHPSLSGINGGSGTSGSTAWNNSVRARMYFERVKNKAGEEDDRDLRLLKMMKANYGPAGEEIVVRWSHGAFSLPNANEPINALIAQEKADRVFLEMLHTYATERRDVRATKGHGYAPHLFADDKRAGGVSARAFADAMNRLFDQNRITTEEYGPPSHRRKRLRPC